MSSSSLSPNAAAAAPLSPSALRRLHELTHHAMVEGLVQFDYNKPIYVREPESATITYVGSDSILVRADAHACPPFWAEAQIYASDWNAARTNTTGTATRVRCKGGRLSNGPSKVCATITAEGKVVFYEAEPDNPPTIYYATVVLPDACTQHLTRKPRAKAAATAAAAATTKNQPASSASASASTHTPRD